MKNILFAFSLVALAASSHASPDKEGVIADYPAVSPSGLEIAFAADFDGVSRIWLVGIDGSRLRRLNPQATPADSVMDTQPTWARDGSKIAYTAFDGEHRDIWVVTTSSPHPVRLTANASNNDSASWSPDGKKIAFISDRDGTRAIWLMNPDGTHQAKLLDSSAQDNTPTFSPNGDQIAFSRTDVDKSSLMVVNTNGSGLRSLTIGASRDWEPSWGPRGITFSSNRNAERSMLWSIQGDGSGLRALGNAAGHDPAWLPDGRIAYVDDSLPSKALSSIAVLDPSTGTRRVIVDVQGYFTPMDIRPRRSPNFINPRSLGKVQVGILSTRNFDAPASVVQRSLTFGRTGAENSLVSCLKHSVDVNGDGLPDLVCRFDLKFSGFAMGDTVGVLRFTDARGVAFEARDAITTVTQDDPDDFKN